MSRKLPPQSRLRASRPTEMFKLYPYLKEADIAEALADAAGRRRDRGPARLPVKILIPEPRFLYAFLER